MLHVPTIYTREIAKLDLAAINQEHGTCSIVAMDCLIRRSGPTLETQVVTKVSTKEAAICVHVAKAPGRDL